VLTSPDAAGSPTQVDVCLALPDELQEPALLRRYEALLDPGERGRLGQFRFDRHRHQYLVTRALVRSVLAERTGSDPESLRFSTSRRGRPELVQTAGAPRLRFNLSHTDGLVACAVVVGVDVGVDVESCERPLEPLALAKTFFARSEAAELYGLIGRDRRERFFTYWTLKEAYVKARGDGLSLPLDRVCFRVRGDGTVDVRFDARLDDGVADWQFVVLKPSAHHRAAVAIRRGARSDLRTRTRKTVPLVCDTSFGCPLLAATAAGERGCDASDVARERRRRRQDLAQVGLDAAGVGPVP